MATSATSLQVRVLRRAAGALGVAEAHALVALLGLHLDEEQHGLGERLLPPGEHLGVTDGVVQRQHDVGQTEVADLVGHAVLLARGPRVHRGTANLYDE